VIDGVKDMPVQTHRVISRLLPGILLVCLYCSTALAPMLDPTYISAMNANRLIRECMTGIAMRRQGITEEHYLSPLTVDDGRD
jgi:hypothetical protein